MSHPCQWCSFNKKNSPNQGKPHTFSAGIPHSGIPLRNIKPSNFGDSPSSRGSMKTNKNKRPSFFQVTLWSPKWKSHFHPLFQVTNKKLNKKNAQTFRKNRSQRKINHPKIFRSEDPGTWICFPRILPRNCSTSSANWVVLNPRADKLIMASGGVKIRNKLIY